MECLFCSRTTIQYFIIFCTASLYLCIHICLCVQMQMGIFMHGGRDLELSEKGFYAFNCHNLGLIQLGSTTEKIFFSTFKFNICCSRQAIIQSQVFHQLCPNSRSCFWQIQSKKESKLMSLCFLSSSCPSRPKNWCQIKQWTLPFVR